MQNRSFNVKIESLMQLVYDPVHMYKYILKQLQIYEFKLYTMFDLQLTHFLSYEFLIHVMVSHYIYIYMI